MSERKTDVLDILKREVAPAIGSLELVSVAYCTAAATSIVGGWAAEIEMEVSPDIVAAAEHDVIPSVGIGGIKTAAALGSLLLNSDRKRMLFDEIVDESVEMALRPEVQEHVHVTVREDAGPWFVYARVHTDWGIGTAEVSGRPDELVLLQMAARKLWEKEPERYELEASQMQTVRTASEAELREILDGCSEKELTFLLKGMEDTRALLREMDCSLGSADEIKDLAHKMEEHVRSGSRLPYMTVADSILQGNLVYLRAVAAEDDGMEQEMLLRQIAMDALKQIRER